MKRKPNPQAAVDRWNATHSVGTDVDLTKDSGEIVRTQTRSAAGLSSNRTPVIWLEGVTGCYLLDRVKAVKP